MRDETSDVGCALKIYRAHFLTDLPAFDGLHRFLPALMQVKGARVVELEVNDRLRVHGDSKYGVHNRLWRGIADLWGVRWLQKRWICVDQVEEVEAWNGRRSGSV